MTLDSTGSNSFLARNAVDTTKISADNTQTRDATRLREAAEGFEEIFIKMMFKSMRQTLDKKNDILYGGFSQDVFEDMLYDEFSKDMAKERVLGLADIIIEQYKQYV